MKCGPRPRVQDVTDPDHVDLNKLRTKLLMQDGSTVFLDSLTGLFRQQGADPRPAQGYLPADHDRL